MVNTSKIKGKMAELGITQKELAKVLGISSSTMSLKLNNARPFTLEEAASIADALKIDDAQFIEIFFAK